MDEEARPRDPIAFGSFEWNPTRAELRKGGVRVKLSGQPLDVLTVLIERADHLVSREELRRRLWGEGTFVDFEQGLNTAIARLRHVLGDSADSPRYIETVQGRGYRFVAPIRPLRTSDAASTAGSIVDRRVLLAGGLGVALGAAGVYLAVPDPRAARLPRHPRRFVVSGPPDPPLEMSAIFQDIAISPDGRRIAYRTTADGATRIYARSLDRIGGALLPETDVNGPFFSPDGAEVGYYKFTSRALFRASIGGGPAVRVTDSPAFVSGASWSADGDIVFGTHDVSEGLMRAPATGGQRQRLTEPQPGTNHVLPEVLPGGQGVLFTVYPVEAPDAARIAVLDLRTGQYAMLMPGSHPRYSATGHLVYLLEDNLVAVAFDAHRLETEGAPVAVLSGVATSTGFWAPTGQYSLASDGSLAVVMNDRGGQRQLVWVGRDGAEAPFLAAPGGYTYPRISPDGRMIALNLVGSKGRSIELWDVARPDSTPQTIGQGLSLYPVWTPDGTKLAYETRVLEEVQLYLKAIDTGGPGTLIDSGELRALYFFSPSGEELVFAVQGTNGAELRSMTLGPSSESTLLLRNARNADLSPDGRHIAYQSDSSGQFEIYVRSFPRTDDRLMRVSVDGGIQPVWSPRGDELFYIQPGPPQRMMSVSVESDSGFGLSRARPLIEWPYYTGELGRTYDVSRPLGDRFLAMKQLAPGSDDRRSRPQVELVLDWSEELKGHFPSNA